MAGILVLTAFALLPDAAVGRIERRLLARQPRAGETGKLWLFRVAKVVGAGLLVFSIAELEKLVIWRPGFPGACRSLRP